MKNQRKTCGNGALLTSPSGAVNAIDSIDSIEGRLS